MSQVDAVHDGKEEGFSADDTTKMITCTKIWFVDSARPAECNSHILNRDRLQSMEKFRNGEIDIENLCDDLKAKARCTEGDAAIHQKDLESILGSAR